jgi:hypothetical protein
MQKNIKDYQTNIITLEYSKIIEQHNRIRNKIVKFTRSFKHLKRNKYLR